MENFARFTGIPREGDVFYKEMSLMGSDGEYTHREKDKIRNRKIRDLIREFSSEIASLMDDTEKKGVYISGPGRVRKHVEVAYRYPNDKNGDIDHAIAVERAISISTDGDSEKAVLPGSDHESIELMVFPAKNFFTGYDFSKVHDEDGPDYLLLHNRIYRIEYLMWQINCYREEFRSLRSIKDIRLRDLLKEHHDSLNSRRNEIYEQLIADGETHARWVSEQKAYSIVKSFYPDAKFQYQPAWLNGQRLDIYIPSKKAAIEYQGKQHTEPVEFFGGSSGLMDNLERDMRKKYFCNVNGVELFYWNYDKPLTKEYFIECIDQYIRSR